MDGIVNYTIRNIGISSTDTAEIVGSVGRAHEMDRYFAIAVAAEPTAIGELKNCYSKDGRWILSTFLKCALVLNRRPVL